jgi:hypothetical protein
MRKAFVRAIIVRFSYRFLKFVRGWIDWSVFYRFAMQGTSDVQSLSYLCPIRPRMSLSLLSLTQVPVRIVLCRNQVPGNFVLSLTRVPTSGICQFRNHRGNTNPNNFK